MKILQLCLRVPYPPNDGATIAMYNLGQSLIEAGAQVKALSFNTKKHFVANDKISKEYKQAVSLETVYLDATVNPLHAFLNFFKSGESYNIKRFYSEEFDVALKKILVNASYDIVQLEGLFLTPYIDTIRRHSKARICLRAHNVEFIIWKRLAAAATNPLKKKYLSFLAERLKNYETSLINSYDAVVALTAEDKNLMQNMGCTRPMHIAPIGIDTAKYDIDNNESDFSLFHLGSMDWLPNIEAVTWFLNNVWDSIKAEIPNIRLHLAGKSMPQKIKKMADKNLFVYDRIDNAKKFMLGKPVMIVPLLSGGGMRVKIIEGLAMGKIVISTSVGSEGIDYADGNNILIADTPQKFTEQVISVYRNSELQKKIKAAAKILASEKYDNKKIGQKLFKFYGDLIK